MDIDDIQPTRIPTVSTRKRQMKKMRGVAFAARGSVVPPDPIDPTDPTDPPEGGGGEPPETGDNPMELTEGTVLDLTRPNYTMSMTLNKTVQMAQFDEFTPVIVNTGGLQVVATTPLCHYREAEATGERGGWVNGLELNPGRSGSQRPGQGNRSMDSTQLHGLDTRGSSADAGGAEGQEAGSGPFVGQGVTPRSSPPFLADDGGFVLKDPAFSGSPLTIEAGQSACLAKAVSLETATVATDRLRGYHEVFVLPKVPQKGDIPPPSANPSLGVLFNVSDINLDGLQSLPVPTGTLLTGYPATTFEQQFNFMRNYLRSSYWQGVMGGGETQRYCRGRDHQADYGRDISKIISAAAQLLHTNITQEQKMELAYGFVKQAVSIYGRISVGGQLNIREAGAQVHYWSLIVAVAAWLVRGSENVGLLTSLLPGGTQYSNFQRHFTHAVRVPRTAWATVSQCLNREVAAPAGHTAGYFSTQIRPHHEGSVVADAGRVGTSACPFSSRFGGGNRSYATFQWVSLYGMLWFLNEVDGGRDLIPLPAYWEWVDSCADMLVHHYQYAGSGDVTRFWYEGFMTTTCLSFYSACFLSSEHAWKWPTKPTPTVTKVGCASTYLASGYVDPAETGASNAHKPARYRFTRENWVWVQYSEYVSRDESRLPVAADFTIKINGVDATIDAAIPVHSNPPPHSGAIQVRGRSIAFALVEEFGADDVITVTTRWSAMTSRPVTLDGKNVPDVSGVTAEWVAAQAPARPTNLQYLSFGGRDTEFDIDVEKAMAVACRSEQQSWLADMAGLQQDTQVNALLIGMRVQTLMPNTRFPNGSRGTNLGVFADSMTSNRTRLRIVNTSGTMQLAVRGENLLESTMTPAGTPFPAAADNAFVQLWLYFDMTFGAANGKVRVGDAAPTDPTIAQANWTSDADLPTLARVLTNKTSFFGVEGNGDPAASASSTKYAVREFMMAIGTPVRPLPEPDFTAPQFSTTADWGSNAQNISPTRDAYPLLNSGAAPELYFAFDLDQGRAKVFPNFGALTGLYGTYHDSLDVNIDNWRVQPEA